MLKKIISVKNVGQFLNASTEKQELTQFVLISADNGYGKTTLCHILRSLQTNDPSYIRSRKSLQSAKEKESEVSLLFNNKNVVFKNKWKVKEGDQDKDIKDLGIGQNLLIHIFDDTYVTTNICSNIEINRRHRSNLLITLATNLIPIDSSYSECIDWLKKYAEKNSAYLEKRLEKRQKLTKLTRTQKKTQELQSRQNEISELKNEISELEKEISELKNKIPELENELTTHINESPDSLEKLFSKYFSLVNANLKEFYVNFEVKQNEPRFIASYGIILEYCLTIYKKDVELNNNKNEPSFKTTLSAGDRNVLALSFFLAELQQLKDFNQHQERLVIFDDPFNSLDSYRRTKTIEKIIKTAQEERNQVIVLSHDKDFLLSLYNKNNNKKNITLLKINSSEVEGSKIEKMEQLDLITQGYIKDVIDIRNYILRGQGDSIEIKIRRVLEEEIKRRNPELYEQATPNYMATLKSSDEENTFTDDEKEKIEGIINYSNEQCHTGANHNKEELKRYAKETLEVLKIRYKSTETPEEK